MLRPSWSRGATSSSSSDADGGASVRIQKFLSRAGVASRRAAEQLMTQGRVRVNGEVIRTLGSRVRPDQDLVEVDGTVVQLPPLRWVMLHKPRGVLTTVSDPQGRPTIYDLLPPELREMGLVHVGRLDLDTSGLLLLGNDGDVIHGLLHPSREVEREYRVGVEGVPDGRVLRALCGGVKLDDGMARVQKAEVVSTESEGAVLGLILREGRKREVRRLFHAVGHPVRWLHRVRFGPMRLGDLPSGEYRSLTAAEVLALREATGKVGRASE